jgi:hypothetical protein
MSGQTATTLAAPRGGMARMSRRVMNLAHHLGREVLDLARDRRPRFGTGGGAG